LETLPVDKGRWLPLSILKNTIRYSILTPGISIFVKLLRDQKITTFGTFQRHNIHTKSGGNWSNDKNLNGEDKEKRLRLCHNLFSFFPSFQTESRVKKGPKARLPSIP
jgi:hypothetical protein